MKRHLVPLVAAILSASLLAMACSQPAPAPTTAPAPTAAPASKAAAPEPTKAPAVLPTAAPAPQPTAVPAKKSDFPVKGKAITIIVPFASGGPNDLAARLLAPIFEKEFGVPVEVVNKAGAGTQVAMTELAKAKPDGHTLAYTTLPSTLTYMDPERKASYGPKDLTVIVQHAKETGSVAVRADSQFKTLKELLDYAKANPGKLKAADNGILTFNNINLLLTQKVAGVKFAAVHFDGTAPELTALLGGHVDAMFSAVNSQTVGPHKSGQIRVLAVMDTAPSKQLPDVPTFESQGYKAYGFVSYGLWAPGGLPADTAATIEGVVKRAIDDPEHQKKVADIGMSLNYMGTAEYNAYKAEQETQFKEFIELAKEEQK